MQTVAFGESTITSIYTYITYPYTEHKFSCGISGLRKARRCQWRCLSWSPEHVNTRWRHWSSEGLLLIHVDCWWCDCEKMSMTSHVRVARAHQQPMKTVKVYYWFTWIANDVGISFSSCQAIFTDVLGMKRAAAKIVSKLLNFKQK